MTRAITALSWPLAVFTACALAQTGDRDARSTEVPVFAPPTRGAPAARVGGGSRGAGQPAVTIWTLAPVSVGLTTRAQPALHWYVSRPVEAFVEITVLDETSDDAMLEAELEGVSAAGIHRISLQELGVELELGVEYEWSVTLVNNPDRRSHDSMSGAVIKRVPLEPAVGERLAAASSLERVFVLAEAGLWYDAIGELSTLIDRSPDDDSLRAYRAALLEQVDLREVARHDRIP